MEGKEELPTASAAVSHIRIKRPPYLAAGKRTAFFKGTNRLGASLTLARPSGRRGAGKREHRKRQTVFVIRVANWGGRKEMRPKVAGEKSMKEGYQSIPARADRVGTGKKVRQVRPPTVQSGMKGKRSYGENKKEQGRRDRSTTKRDQEKPILSTGCTTH